jgi:hypothetical protein
MTPLLFLFSSVFTAAVVGVLSCKAKRLLEEKHTEEVAEEVDANLDESDMSVEDGDEDAVMEEGAEEEEGTEDALMDEGAGEEEGIEEDALMDEGACEEEGEDADDEMDEDILANDVDAALIVPNLEGDEVIEHDSDDMSVDSEDDLMINAVEVATKGDIDSLRASMSQFATCEGLDLVVQQMHLLSTQESVAAIKADINSQNVMSSAHSSELKNLNKVCTDLTATLSDHTNSFDTLAEDLAALKGSSSIHTISLATLTSMSEKHTVELANLNQSCGQQLAETKSLTQLFVNQGSDLVNLRNLSNIHTDELKQVKDLCAMQAAEIKHLKDLFSTITTQGTFVNSLGLKVEGLTAETKSLKTQNDALTGHIKGLLKLTDEMSVSFEALELIENKIGTLEMNAEKIEVLDEKIVNMSKVISSMTKK